jgi:hypothetical protein
MTLNLEAFGDQSKKKNQAKYKAALGVSSVVGLFGIGSTLAANISLNGGGNVEFGQGVATTAACDEDGFNITPITSFDNEHGIFRVDRVEVTGIDLTPEGTGYSDGGYLTQDAAKEAHPGQYYDTVTSDWKRTCDNVVLDFKAFTNEQGYAKYTLDGYKSWAEDQEFSNSLGTTSPLMWVQKFAAGSSELLQINSGSHVASEAPGFAVAFDAWDVVQTSDDYENNYFIGYSDGSGEYWTGIDGSEHIFIGDAAMNGTNSSFEFVLYTDYRPNAAAISKITVQSFKYAPENYSRSDNDGPGTSGYNPNGG